MKIKFILSAMSIFAVCSSVSMKSHADLSERYSQHVQAKVQAARAEYEQKQLMEFEAKPDAVKQAVERSRNCTTSSSAKLHCARLIEGMVGASRSAEVKEIGRIMSNARCMEVIELFDGSFITRDINDQNCTR